MPAGCYLPKQLGDRYNFPPGDGTGQTVALLEFGGGYFPEDLQQFCRLAGIAVPKVTVVSTDARDGPPSLNGILTELNGQAAPLAQPGLIPRPTRHAVFGGRTGGGAQGGV